MCVCAWRVCVVFFYLFMFLWLCNITRMLPDVYLRAFVVGMCRSVFQASVMNEHFSHPQNKKYTQNYDTICTQTTHCKAYSSSASMHPACDLPKILKTKHIHKIMIQSAPKPLTVRLVRNRHACIRHAIFQNSKCRYTLQTL